jgi:tetratricopeptide (TPR) repeat protein
MRKEYDRHPDTALSLNNLAELYDSMGDYDRSLPLYEDAVSLFEKLLGHDHPNTKVVQGNLQ